MHCRVHDWKHSTQAGRPLTYVAKQSQDTHATSCQADESRQTIIDVCVPDAVQLAARIYPWLTPAASVACSASLLTVLLAPATAPFAVAVAPSSSSSSS